MSWIGTRFVAALFRRAADKELGACAQQGDMNHRPLLAADRLSGTSYEFMLPELLQDVSSRSRIGRIG